MQARLNAALQFHLDATAVHGEPVLVDVTAWMQEHGAEFLAQTSSSSDDPTNCSPSPKTVVCLGSGDDGVFTRYWILSHHIYSRVKRRDLLQLAEQLRLTGFCHPGKPGIICVEVSAYDAS